MEGGIAEVIRAASINAFKAVHTFELAQFIQMLDLTTRKKLRIHFEFMNFESTKESSSSHFDGLVFQKLELCIHHDGIFKHVQCSRNFGQIRFSFFQNLSVPIVTNMGLI